MVSYELAFKEFPGSYFYDCLVISFSKIMTLNLNRIDFLMI